MLAEAWDENINGHIFTIRLAEMIADAYDAQPSRKGKHSVKDDPKKWLKILQKIGKYKEALTTSKEVRIFFEFLDEFQLKITKDEYELKC